MQTRAEHEGQQQRHDEDRDVADAMDGAALDQRLVGEGLQRGPRDGAPERDRHHVAKLHGGGADDDLPAGDGGGVEVSAQHVDIGEVMDRADADAEVDIKRAGGHRRFAGEKVGKGREPFVARLGDRDATDGAVLFRTHVEAGDPHVAAEFGQRAGLEEPRPAVRARVLAEDGENDAMSGGGERRLQPPVVLRVRARTQVDIDRDLLRPGGDEPVEHLRVAAPRPGPYPDFAEAVFVDLDENETARGVALVDPGLEVHELMFDELQGAAEIETGDEEEDQDVWQVPCHGAPSVAGSHAFSIPHQAEEPVNPITGGAGPAP